MADKTLQIVTHLINIISLLPRSYKFRLRIRSGCKGFVRNHNKGVGNHSSIASQIVCEHESLALDCHFTSCSSIYFSVVFFCSLGTE